MTSPALRLAARLDPRRALGRVFAGLLVGGVGAAIAALEAGFVVSGVIGWDLGALVVLVLSWEAIFTCDARATEHRAGRDDPGRTAVYVMVLLGSAVSLLAAVLLSRKAKTFAPAQADAVVALCLAAVALAWALTHTAFTLRYAHLYYREDAEGVGGVDVPGGQPPTYFDFAYLAFTVGMCFQVSDVTISSPQIRRAVLAQALLAFAYNTLILAFALNLVFGSFAGG